MHCACFSAETLDIINMLSLDYPNGSIKFPDIKGWLPMHISVKNNTNINESNKLLLMHPDCVDYKTLMGCTSLTCDRTSQLCNKNVFISFFNNDNNNESNNIDTCMEDYFSNNNERIHVGIGIFSKNRLN